jgi:hypothetical protein
MALTDGVEHLPFDGAEACFSIPFKNGWNRAAGGLFDDGIGIDKAVTQTFR